MPEAHRYIYDEVDNIIKVSTSRNDPAKLVSHKKKKKKKKTVLNVPVRISSSSIITSATQENRTKYIAFEIPCQSKSRSLLETSTNPIFKPRRRPMANGRTKLHNRRSNKRIRDPIEDPVERIKDLRETGFTDKTPVEICGVYQTRVIKRIILLSRKGTSRR